MVVISAAVFLSACTQSTGGFFSSLTHTQDKCRFGLWSALMGFPLPIPDSLPANTEGTLILCVRVCTTDGEWPCLDEQRKDCMVICHASEPTDAQQSVRVVPRIRISKPIREQNLLRRIPKAPIRRPEAQMRSLRTCKIIHHP